VPISDAVVHALRTRLTVRSDSDFDEAAGEFLTVAKADAVDGLGELTYAAFACAARSRWADGWTYSDLVRFVADVRSSSDEAATMLNATAAENQLRIALGDNLAAYPDMECRARAQFFLLCILTADFAADDLDHLLADARAAADGYLGGVRPQQED
jgi:hypothetical protein